MNNQKILGLSLITILLCATISMADPGEVAGYLYYNLSVGQTKGLGWTLINTGNIPISFNVPSVSTSNNYSITTNQSNGIISAGGTFPINVIVDLKTAGSYNGMIYAIFPSTSNTGETNLNIEINKLFFISTITATMNVSSTTTIQPSTGGTNTGGTIGAGGNKPSVTPLSTSSTTTTITSTSTTTIPTETTIGTTSTIPYNTIPTTINTTTNSSANQPGPTGNSNGQIALVAVIAIVLIALLLYSKYKEGKKKPVVL